MAVTLKPKPVYCSRNETLTSGITKLDSSLPILSEFQHYSYDNITYRLVVQTNTLVKAVAGAALSFGEHLWTWPDAVIKVVGATVEFTGYGETGISATAGEVGLGTVIGSGANATLGAVGATSENIMEGKTIEDHVAVTTLTQYLAGAPVAGGDHGAGTNSSGTNPGTEGFLNATAGTLKSHLNVASTWAGTGNTRFSAKIVCTYTILSTGNYGTIG